MSDALQMADELDRLGSEYDSEIAAELRRLHAENEALQFENRTLVRQNGQWQALNAECEELEALRERLSQLLKATAVAIRGPEPELASWGWHDLPERAAKIKALNAELVEALQKIALTDYRGNQSQEIAIARAALAKVEASK